MENERRHGRERREEIITKKKMSLKLKQEEEIKLMALHLKTDFPDSKEGAITIYKDKQMSFSAAQTTGEE